MGSKTKDVFDGCPNDDGVKCGNKQIPNGVGGLESLVCRSASGGRVQEHVVIGKQPTHGGRKP